MQDTGQAESRRQLEKQLRVDVMGAWNEFKASSESPPAQQDHAAHRDQETFWRYQRAMKRLNDLLVNNKLPE